jgi:putative transposase
LVQEVHSNGIEINLACNTLEVSRSGYYAWVDRPGSDRAKENAVLIEQIKEIHKSSDKTYGSPRIVAELKSKGFSCSENRAAKLMKKNNISSESVKKFKVITTDSDHDLPVADRVFETENVDSIMGPNQVWAGDITYIPTNEGWLYLAVFLDVFTRKIVGFSSGNHMRSELVIDALKMALGRQQIEKGQLISHTDRGSQYASQDYREQLEMNGIIASMSRKGNCWDNAHAESFFHTLKAELIYRRIFETREEAVKLHVI